MKAWQHIDLSIAQNEFDAWVDACRELDRAWEIWEAADARKAAASKRCADTRDAFDARLRQEWNVIQKPYSAPGENAGNK